MTNSYPDQEQMLPGLLLIQIKAQPGREQRRLGFLPPSKDFSFLLVVGVIFLPRSQTGGRGSWMEMLIPGLPSSAHPGHGFP